MTEYTISIICDLNKYALNAKDKFDAIQYLDTSSITDGHISNIQNIEYSEAPSRAKRKVSDKTIVFSTVRPNLRHFGILYLPAENFIVSTGFVTIDVKAQYKEKIVPEYVYLLLTQPTVIAKLQMVAESAVTSYPSINPSDIGALSFDFPDYETQKRIASVLSNIDRKIALNRAMNEELEQTARDLYDYWFLQFDFPDANGKPYRSSGGKMIYNPQLKREIPEGWEVGNLYKIANFTNGLACQNFRPKNDEKKLPVIKIGEMHNGISDTTEYVKFDIPEKVKIYDGDILFSWSASLEVMLWANGDGGLNQHIFKVTSNNGYPKSFILYELKDYVKVFKKIAESRKTTMGHITSEHLKQSAVCLPPTLDVPNAFEAKVSPLLEQIVANTQELIHLRSLRDELLPLLINGQVKVKE